MENDVIIVETFADILAANLAKDKLSANGIESILEDQNVLGLNPLGEIELKVFSDDLKRAKEILAEPNS